MHVILVDDGVAKLGLLATVPEGIVVGEVCDFLATLINAYPRYAVN
jgi:hypothetical protein